MKARPILFSAPMVRALLDGTKTQTRRVVKYPAAGKSGWHPDRTGWQFLPGGSERPVCPYGRPGDQLWVRETHARIFGQSGNHIETDYRATYQHGDRLGDSIGIKKKWTPAIHMFRGDSRITLEITGVRVERLHDISETDAIAEGIEQLESPHAGVALYRDYAAGHDSTVSPIHSYLTLWEKINGAGSWAANPLVWVVEFKRITA